MCRWVQSVERVVRGQLAFVWRMDRRQGHGCGNDQRGKIISRLATLILRLLLQWKMSSIRLKRKRDKSGRGAEMISTRTEEGLGSVASFFIRLFECATSLLFGWCVEERSSSSDEAWAMDSAVSFSFVAGMSTPFIFPFRRLMQENLPWMSACCMACWMRRSNRCRPARMVLYQMRWSTAVRETR